MKRKREVKLLASDGTALSRTGHRDYMNLKPYRNKEQKQQAKKSKVNDKGYFTSMVPTLRHKPMCEPHRCICRRYSKKEENND